MSFNERLTKLMECIGITNPELAEFAGIDRTYPAHFKSGRRTPKQGSQTAYSIAEGIFAYCEKKNKTDKLKKLILLEDEDPCGSILSWLYKESADETKKSQPDKKELLSDSAVRMTFKERFDIAMKLAGMSNIRLSRSINVDASLISRYRSGARIPRPNSEIVAKLGETLWQNIRKNNAVNSLAGYMKTGSESIYEEQFLNWLFETDINSESGVNAAIKLLRMIDSYSMQKSSSQLPPLELQKLNYTASSQKIYQGYKGMREAVIRFLLGVINSDAEHICLYSDQNMDWLLSDMTFMIKWAALMGECVKKGVRIRIIHNIDRNPQEMVEAIGMWLPLYMSGMIEPYFCKKPKDPRFSHSLFLCPKHFCVEGNHVIGTEAEGIYSFRDDKTHLKLNASAFEKLMENAEQLVSFAPADKSGETFDISEFDSDEGLYDEESFKNIRFSIKEDSVIIEHLTDPALIFRFTHSTMVRAFKAYAAHKKKIGS